MEEKLSRDFLLSCALSPVAKQRPADLSLDRTEDWVKDIVLVKVSILYLELTCKACHGKLSKLSKLRFFRIICVSCNTCS